MKHKVSLLFVLLTFISSRVFSESPPSFIEGPGSVTSGVAYTYSFTKSLVAAPMWSILSGSATINSTWSSGITYYASITWTSSGTMAFYDEVLGAYAEKVITVMGSSIGDPTPIPNSRCGTGTVELGATLGSGGDKVRWYSTQSGGSYIAEGLTYTTPSLSTTTSYYIETWNSTTSQGSSPRIEIEATINPAVSVPVSLVGGESCGASTFSLSASPGTQGTTVIWYTSPIGENIAYTGTAFNTPELTASTTYYVASQDAASGCESARVEVLALVNEKPNNSWTHQLSNVYGSGTTDLKAYLYYEVEDDDPNYVYPDIDPQIDTDEFEVNWYATEANASSGTSRLYEGVTFTTPLISSTSSYYYRLRNKDTNCLGNISIATATVIPLITSAKIQTDVIRVEGKKNEAALTGLTNAEKTTSIVYLDGIGRARQQIIMAGAQSGKDIVMPVDYDDLGRSSKSYLPYTANTSGNFQSSYLADQLLFYQAGSDKIANDSAPFVVSEFEDTPDGRLIEQGGVGSVWQPGEGRTSTMKYGFNTGSTNSEAEEVRKFNADASSSGFYTANQLYRLETTNPQGYKEIVFSNSLGQTIAKKTQLDKTTEGVMVNYIQTYYCYNEVGQLTYIIQPKGVKALKSASWVVTQTLKDQYMFQYTYDALGRIITKRVPGSDWEYIVYDQLNRPVLTQDANIRASNQWNFIKYDNRGRAVITGLYTDAVNTTRSALQNVLDLKNYDGSDSYFEVRQASTTHGYSNQAFPTANIQIKTVNYFDDHDFNLDGTPDYSYTPQGLPNEGNPVSSSFGRSTGLKVLIDDGTGSNWKVSYVFHDKDGRVIQTRSNNHLSTTNFNNLSTTVYDFEKVTYTKLNHTDGTNQVAVINRPVYDDVTGRLEKLYQSLNGGAEQLVVQYEYNDLGQLVDKKLHGTGTPGSETFLQSVDFRYAINGQLLSINNAQLTAGDNNDETNDYFGMELLYNGTETGLGNTARYDGNISAIKWKATGDTNGTAGQRSYKFVYDKSNKLESATSQVRGSTNWDREANAQNETMTYDLNGNIKSMQRNQRKHQLSGVVSSYAADQIDNLTYTYNSSNSNRLDKVTDASQSLGFNNGTSGTATDYTYYSNGNIKSDLNKGISLITYNHLGKTTEISFTDGRKITYLYDAVGNKLSMKTYQGTTLQTTTDYADGFVYEAGTLSFFGSPEGRVVKKGSVFEYQYAIADHQGNTRVVFSSVAPDADTSQTGFESNSGEFENDDVNLSSTFGVMNKTAGGTKSQLLTGGYNSQIGATKTVKVYPGDKIKAEVYAKYWNTSGVGGEILDFATALTGAFGVSPSSTGEMLNTYNGLNNYGSFTASGNKDDDDGSPKGFINILVFDKNHNLIDASWDQLDGAYDQNGVVNNDPFDHLEKEIEIKQEGYVYIYLSNEHPTKVDIHFDDFKVTHTKSNVIQYNEYYPFGLQTSSSWTRDDNKNDYLYNAGSELNSLTSIYETMFRGYDAQLGRFMQVDPLAVVDNSTTPFAYAGNNPAMFNDPSGLLKASVHDLQVFIGKALRGHGGRWNDSESEPTYYGSDTEQGEWILNNWSLFGNVKTGEGGGSALTENAYARVAGLSTGASWVHYKYDLKRKIRKGNTVSFKYRGLDPNIPGFPGASFFGQFRHLFGPDAIGIFGNIDLVFPPQGGVDTSPIGAIFILKGPDRGKLVPIFDIAYAQGIDISASVKLTSYYFNGDLEEMNSRSFLGGRIEANVAFTAGVDFGYSISMAPNLSSDNFFGAFKNAMFSESHSIGVGIPGPFLLNGNVNVGYTFDWRDIIKTYKKAIDSIVK